MTQPLISVIVPVYNTEPYLAACLDSALAQAGGVCELVVVDDGSTDGSGALCDRYAEKYPGLVRVYHQPNAGPVAAKRHAMARARGEYILSLDADDCLAEGAIAALTDILRRHAPDIVIYRLTRIHADGSPAGDDSPAFFPEGLVPAADVLGQLATEYLSSLCLKLTRRALFDLETDYTRYAAVTIGDDQLISIPAVMNAERIYYYPVPLYLYRLNPTSIMLGESTDRRQGNFLYLTLVRPRLREAMRALSADDEPRLADFHAVNIIRLWRLLDIAGRTGETDALTALLRDPLIQESRRYLPHAPLSPFRKLVVRAYYAGRIGAAMRLLRVRNRLISK